MGSPLHCSACARRKVLLWHWRCQATTAAAPVVHMAVLQLTSAMKVSCLCSAYAGRRAEADAVRYHAGVESFDISVPDKKVRRTASLPWATVEMYLPCRASQQLVMVVARAVVCKMCNIHACGENTWTPLCQCYWIKSAECTSRRLSRLLCCICRSSYEATSRSSNVLIKCRRPARPQVSGSGVCERSAGSAQCAARSRLQPAARVQSHAAAMRWCRTRILAALHDYT